MADLVDYLRDKLERADGVVRIIRFPAQVTPLAFGRYRVICYDEPLRGLDAGAFGWTTVVWGRKRAESLAAQHPLQILP